MIDGKIYYMAPPSRIHQKVLGFVYTSIYRYIQLKGGPCEVYPAPFGVFLDGNDDKYIEPDISVICDPNKLDDRGCKGAPDWIIEIVSPSNSSYDYLDKLALYKAAGVREYWIINPGRKVVTIYNLDNDLIPWTYTFDNKIKVNSFDDLVIDFTGLNI